MDPSSRLVVDDVVDRDSQLAVSFLRPQNGKEKCFTHHSAWSNNSGGKWITNDRGTDRETALCGGWMAQPAVLNVDGRCRWIGIVHDTSVLLPQTGHDGKAISKQDEAASNVTRCKTHDDDMLVRPNVTPAQSFPSQDPHGNPSSNDERVYGTPRDRLPVESRESPELHGNSHDTISNEAEPTIVPPLASQPTPGIADGRAVVPVFPSTPLGGACEDLPSSFDIPAVVNIVNARPAAASSRLSAIVSNTRVTKTGHIHEAAGTETSASMPHENVIDEVICAWIVSLASRDIVRQNQHSLRRLSTTVEATLSSCPSILAREDGGTRDVPLITCVGDEEANSSLVTHIVLKIGNRLTGGSAESETHDSIRTPAAHDSRDENSGVSRLTGEGFRRTAQLYERAPRDRTESNTQFNDRYTRRRTTRSKSRIKNSAKLPLISVDHLPSEKQDILPPGVGVSGTVHQENVVHGTCLATARENRCNEVPLGNKVSSEQVSPEEKSLPRIAEGPSALAPAQVDSQTVHTIPTGLSLTEDIGDALAVLLHSGPTMPLPVMMATRTLSTIIPTSEKQPESRGYVTVSDQRTGAPSRHLGAAPGGRSSRSETRLGSTSPVESMSFKLPRRSRQDVVACREAPITGPPEMAAQDMLPFDNSEEPPPSEVMQYPHTEMSHSLGKSVSTTQRQATPVDSDPSLSESPTKHGAESKVHCGGYLGCASLVSSLDEKDVQSSIVHAVNHSVECADLATFRRCEASDRAAASSKREGNNDIRLSNEGETARRPDTWCREKTQGLPRPLLRMHSDDVVKVAGEHRAMVPRSVCKGMGEPLRHMESRQAAPQNGTSYCLPGDTNDHHMMNADSLAAPTKGWIENVATSSPAPSSYERSIPATQIFATRDHGSQIAIVENSDTPEPGSRIGARAARKCRGEVCEGGISSAEEEVTLKGILPAPTTPPETPADSAILGRSMPQLPLPPEPQSPPLSLFVPLMEQETDHGSSETRWSKSIHSSTRSGVNDPLYSPPRLGPRRRHGRDWRRRRVLERTVVVANIGVGDEGVRRARG